MIAHRQAVAGKADDALDVTDAIDRVDEDHHIAARRFAAHVRPDAAEDVVARLQGGRHGVGRHLIGHVTRYSCAWIVGGWAQRIQQIDTEQQQGEGDEACPEIPAHGRSLYL